MRVARKLQRIAVRRGAGLLPRRNRRRRAFSSLGEAAAIWSKKSALGVELSTAILAVVEQQEASYAKGGEKVSDIPIARHDGYIEKDQHFGINYPAYDDGATKPSLLGHVVPDILTRAPKIHLHTNTHVYFDTTEESNNWRAKVFGSVWPDTDTPAIDDLTKPWTKFGMVSDYGVELFCWYGCAGHRIRKPLDTDFNTFGLEYETEDFKNSVGYVMPLTKFAAYEVREEYERYGACAFFDSDKKLIGIYVSYMDDVVHPGDEFWDHAKYVLKTTAVTEITMNEHLGMVHLIVGNNVCTAVRERLPPTHPLRGFLQPHLFHTATANSNVAVLLSYYGFFHKSWALSFDAVYGSIGDYRGTYEFVPLPEFVEAQGMGDETNDIEYPFRDSLKLYEIIRCYVSNFLDLYYESDQALQADTAVAAFWRQICLGNRMGRDGDKLNLDNLKKVLTSFIMNGSGYHRHVGTMLPYLVQDDFVGTRISRGQTRQDIQAFAGAAALGVATTGIEPKLTDDYSHVFVRDHKLNDVMKNFKDFQETLRFLTLDIDNLNEIRPIPYLNFNPRVLGCAVSV